MCSIMGFCGNGADFERFRQCFERTVSRGPDDSRIVDTGRGLLGFHRLSIMGLTPAGMQPFELDGSFAVCNGEIYGFERFREELIGKGYRFQSGSDCEILLPLYREYGADMFSMLDAEFACIIYDAEQDEYIAARDPIGIRPLYFGYDPSGVPVFASEPKNLVGLVEKIMPFPPGYYFKNGEFTCYCDIAAVDTVCRDELPEVCRNIREKLTAGVEKRLVADAKVGFLLSGGLDSSLVCAIAARKSAAPIRTFAIGMSEDAIDLKYARQAAEYIGSEHQEIYMSPEDVTASLEEVIQILGTFDITTIRASIGMYLICRAIHQQTDIRVLLTGEISDELFGYKYTDFAPSAEAFQTEAQKRLRELHMYDVLRADRCISVNALEARVPFGDLDFVKYVMAVDPELKLNRYGKGKYLLRRAFEDGDYLPPEILWREKAAFSDAVGHSMVDYLKQYAEEQYSD
ncbi:MAG: asparagine synthase B, partial [Clostridia bacterium]|nr:asparagine synthase B [Clostridia bacterium]